MTMKLTLLTLPNINMSQGKTLPLHCRIICNFILKQKKLRKIQEEVELDM